MRKSKIRFMVPRNREFLDHSSEEQKQISRELENLPKAVLESNFTTNAKIYYRMARAVSREIHYHKMFTRLKIEGNAVLTGIIQPEHEIEDILLKFFYQRFPKFVIILNSTRKKRTYFIGPIDLKKIMDKKSILVKTEANFILGESTLKLKKLLLILSPLVKDHSLFKGIIDTELDLNKLFKEFYDSQYIESRENYRLFFQNMPKKYQKKQDMVIEKTFRTKTLDKFLNE
jgi:hypothetical protein